LVQMDIYHLDYEEYNLMGIYLDFGLANLDTLCGYVMILLLQISIRIIKNQFF
jgi:hypothetical protein